MSQEQIFIYRRAGWALFYFLLYIPITTTLGFVCAVGVYAFIQHDGPSSFFEALIFLGFLAGIGVWIWLITFTIRLFHRRKVPLAVIDNIGVRLPHETPDFLAWVDVDRVELIKLGKWTNLRFVLHEPEKYMGSFRRRLQWPYHDSQLVRLELDGSLTPSDTLIAIQIAHRQNQNGNSGSV